MVQHKQSSSFSYSYMPTTVHDDLMAGYLYMRGRCTGLTNKVATIVTDNSGFFYVCQRITFSFFMYLKFSPLSII